MRAHPAPITILVLVAIASAWLAAPAHAALPRHPASAPPQSDLAAAPAHAAPLDRPQPPVATDLRPRPLGPNRDARPTITSQSDQQSAASTLWSNPTIRTAGSLLLVLFLIFALASIAKRISGRGASLAAALGPGGRAPEGLLEVLGRYPIARGQTLILLKLDSRILLLSQTLPRIRGGVGTLSTLCELTHPEDVASILSKASEHDERSHTARFSALLHAFDRSHAPAAHEDHTDLDPRAFQHADAARIDPRDDNAPATVVHKFPHAQPPLDPRSAAAHSPQFTPPQMPGPDSFTSIRQRLHALKGEAHR